MPAISEENCGPVRPRIAAWTLLRFLATFSLFIGDYSLLSLRLICVAFFLAVAIYLVLSRREPLALLLPFACPMLMALYGIPFTFFSAMSRAAWARVASRAAISAQAAARSGSRPRRSRQAA